MANKRNYILGDYESVTDEPLGSGALNVWNYFELDGIFKFELSDIVLKQGGVAIPVSAYELAVDNLYTGREAAAGGSGKTLHAMWKITNPTYQGMATTVDASNFGTMTDNEAVYNSFVAKITDMINVGDLGDNNKNPTLLIERSTPGAKAVAGLVCFIGSSSNSVIAATDGAGNVISNSELFYDKASGFWRTLGDFVACENLGVNDCGDNSKTPTLLIERSTPGAKAVAGLVCFIGSSGNSIIAATDGAGNVISNSELFYDKASGFWRTLGNFHVGGALSKSSGSFKITHPLKEKEETHYLMHSFIEGPQADNIYRGKAHLKDGLAVVNIDSVAGMTEGTFEALNREVQVFTTNESNFNMVKGSVVGNKLTIEAEKKCNDLISWMVIGERQDKHMYDTSWTDKNGKVIVEPLRSETLTEEKARLKKEEEERLKRIKQLKAFKDNK